MLRTKRITLTVAAATLTLSAPALARAAEYRGGVEGDRQASVSLEVKKRDGKRLVTGFTVSDFRITCKEPGDARLANASLSGSAAIGKRRHFRLEGENQTQNLAMKGRLVGKRAARGKFSFSGEVALEGEDLECESGELTWKARR